MPRSLGLFVHTAAPNTALVKSSGRKDVQVVIGGRMLALPVLQRVDRLSLALRTITVRTSNGLTINGVGVNVESACQIKIQSWSSEGMVHSDGGNPSTDLHMDISAVRLAAQHFLGKSDTQIEDTISKTVSGHQRAIIGSLTVEELYRDRATFCKRVLDLISADMRNMGLTVVSYTVSEINDSNGYIDALGVTQTEKVKREAVEGAAENRAAAKSHSAREDARAHLEVNTQMKRKIESDRDRSIAEAMAQETILRQRAVQAKSHDISSAEQDAILLVKRQFAKAKETEAELAVMKQQVERERLLKQKQVNVEADAKLYQARVNAEAHVAAAKAEAEKVTLVGQAEADAVRAKGMAEVEILRQRIEAWRAAYVIIFIFISIFSIFLIYFIRILTHSNFSNLLVLILDYLTFLLQAVGRSIIGKDDRAAARSGKGGLVTPLKDRKDGICRKWRARRAFSVCGWLKPRSCRGTTHRQGDYWSWRRGIG